jgi:hypothetical protein
MVVRRAKMGNRRRPALTLFAQREALRSVLLGATNQCVTDQRVVAVVKVSSRAAHRGVSRLAHPVADLVNSNCLTGEESSASTILAVSTVARMSRPSSDEGPAGEASHLRFRERGSIALQVSVTHDLVGIDRKAIHVAEPQTYLRQSILTRGHY